MNRLSGLRVWVTRPVAQAEALCDAIEAAGGHALRQPLLAIEAPTDPAGSDRGLNSAAGADDLIFTSANAVAGAWRLRPDFRPTGQLAAVGAATAAALRAATGRKVLAPTVDTTSEGLLALSRFDNPAGRRVMIIGGEGGRTTLADTLEQRGAEVGKVAVYRRQPVTPSRPRLQALVAEADVLVITSGEALTHLAAITPAALWPDLRTRQLVVPSERVLKRAQDLGFNTMPLRPPRMDDAAILETLARCPAAGHGIGRGSA